ncbi:MAG: hypothetical protein WC375_01010 [Methanomassiliicoccales archaeon]|jgi:hypothetical protein
MTSKVKVHMNICDRITTIEVNASADGTYDVHVISPCAHVREFAKGLEKLTLTDIIDKKDGKVINRFREVKMSANCSVPAGLLNAAWLEAGMIAQSRARKEKGNEIEFVFD